MLPQRMTLTAAPGLPLVIGIPFLCMLVVGIAIAGVWWAMGRASRR